ncbi:MAG: hypothetical protein IJW55_03515 [Clostridia bacterium]|nr:hypothetical protein [Clostridia bacterium]
MSASTRNASLYETGAERYYPNATLTHFTDYQVYLAPNGYRQYFYNEIGENRYAGYEKDGHSIYFYYLAAYGEICVMEGDYQALPVYTEDSRVTDYTVTNFGFDFTQFDYDGASQTTRGQSQIMTLADGSYIIIDGGGGLPDLDGDDSVISAEQEAYGQAVAARLYQYLADNNKREDGNIVIAAWVMTHLHRDHCNTFERFSANYGKRDNVQIHYFMYSYPYSNQMLNQSTSGATKSYDTDTVISYILSTYYPPDNAPVVFVPHTSQSFRFGGWEMEVLTTYNDLDVSLQSSTNELCMVFRFTLNKDTENEVGVLFLGDIYTNTATRLVALYGDELKSTVVQAAHHGFADGGNETLYSKIQAEHVFWCYRDSNTDAKDWLTAANANVKLYAQCQNTKNGTDDEYDTYYAIDTVLTIGSDGSIIVKQTVIPTTN